MHLMSINGREFNCSSLARHYNLPYNTVLKLYRQGFRNEELIEESKRIQQLHRPVIVNGKWYPSRNAAATALKVPKTTFYRKHKS